MERRVGDNSLVGRGRDVEGATWLERLQDGYKALAADQEKRPSYCYVLFCYIYCYCLSLFVLYRSLYILSLAAFFSIG